MDLDTFRRFYTRDWVDIDGSTNFNLREFVNPLPRTRGGRSIDLGGFFAVVGSILKEEDPKIVFAPAYPDFIIEAQEHTATRTAPLPKIPYTVAFRTIFKIPGVVSGSNIQEPKPMIREDIAAETETSIISTYGQRFDAIVQFDCISATRFEAEILAEFMENLIVQHTKLIMSLGTPLIRFKKRLEDERILSRVPAVSLQYDVRLEKIYYVDTKKIEEIRAKFQI